MGFETPDGRPISRTMDLVATAPLILGSRFKQFDWVAVGVFQLDLAAARTGLHLVAKKKTRPFLPERM